MMSFRHGRLYVLIALTAVCAARRLSDLLTKRRITHEYHESEGGHTWINWRASRGRESRIAGSAAGESGIDEERSES